VAQRVLGCKGSVCALLGQAADACRVGDASAACCKLSHGVAGHATSQVQQVMLRSNSAVNRRSMGPV
jgi:hypothetical protein